MYTVFQRLSMLVFPKILYLKPGMNSIQATESKTIDGQSEFLRAAGQGKRDPLPISSSKFILRRYFHLQRSPNIYKSQKSHTGKPKPKCLFRIRLFQRGNTTKNFSPLESIYKKIIYLLFNCFLSIEHPLRTYFLHSGFKL